MKFSISYKHHGWQEPVEVEAAHHLGKISKLLKTYAPDLVQLHGGFEKHPRKSEFMLSLNLSLPTGTLHATGVGSDVRTCVKRAFAEIEGQIKKHKSKLRKDYQWKRKRPHASARG